MIHRKVIQVIEKKLHIPNFQKKMNKFLNLSNINNIEELHSKSIHLNISIIHFPLRVKDFFNNYNSNNNNCQT